jgi:GNAT superfamily N-acetyltransferase
MSIDEFSLARMVVGVNEWLDRVSGPPGLIQQSFDGGEFGAAYMSVAIGDDSPHASANFNRIHLLGREGGLTEAGLLEMIDRFGRARVSKFFIWLSPGPEMDVVRRWLSDAGLSRVPYVDYPTLMRDVSPPQSATSNLVVKEIEASEAREIGDRLEAASSRQFRRSIGTSGMLHFVAWDGDQPVASAALAVFEGLGYLTMAFTNETHRRRGAQQALIAVRIERARQCGCRVLASETLSILETSLGNLNKAGFRPLYEKEVYTRS